LRELFLGNGTNYLELRNKGLQFGIENKAVVLRYRIQPIVAHKTAEFALRITWGKKINKVKI
jgi:hypothetical protein